MNTSFSIQVFLEAESTLVHRLQQCGAGSGGLSPTSVCPPFMAGKPFGAFIKQFSVLPVTTPAVHTTTHHV